MADLTKRFGQAPSHDDVSRALHTVRTDVTAYTPDDPSKWDGSPTTITDALNRIAALLYTLNSDTAIP